MIMIKKYIRGAILAVFMLLAFGFNYFKNKSKRLDKELEAQKKRHELKDSQLKTHLENQKTTQEDIQNAKDHSYIKRDHFE